jgi:hypothetical protein
MAVLLCCLPPLTWTATGLLAGWLATRRGKSWRWGFALGFFCSIAGVMLAALPRGSSPRSLGNPKRQRAIRRFVHSLALRVSEACAPRKRKPL